MLVVWDEAALDDLESIGAFIANDSPRTARRLVEFLRDKAQALAHFPHLGIADDNAEHTRTLILPRYPYVLVYQVLNDEIRILAVFHQSQNRP